MARPGRKVVLSGTLAALLAVSRHVAQADAERVPRSGRRIRLVELIPLERARNAHLEQEIPTLPANLAELGARRGCGRTRAGFH